MYKWNKNEINQLYDFQYRAETDTTSGNERQLGYIPDSSLVGATLPYNSKYMPHKTGVHSDVYICFPNQILLNELGTRLLLTNFTLLYGQFPSDANEMETLLSLEVVNKLK